MTRPKFSFDFNLGHLINAGAIIGVGLIAWGAAGEKQTNTTNAVSDFRRQVELDLGAMRSSFRTDLDRLQSSVDNLTVVVNPIGALNTRVGEVERRLVLGDTRDAQMQDRQSALAESIASLRARVEFITTPGRRLVP